MRTARAVGLVCAGLLALGVVQAPTSASAADGGPTAAELRTHVRSFDTGSAFAADRPEEARRVDVVRDPRGDGARVESARGPRPYSRLADLTRVRYKTPSRVGGDLRITTRWAYLADARRQGARRQTQVSFFSERRASRGWYVEVTNDSDRVTVVEVDDDTGEIRRIRPDDVRIRRDLGRDGSVDVILSTEWLDARRLAFGSFAFAGRFDAYDDTGISKVLDVGPMR